MQINKTTKVKIKSLPKEINMYKDEAENTYSSLNNLLNNSEHIYFESGEMTEIIGPGEKRLFFEWNMLVNCYGVMEIGDLSNSVLSDEDMDLLFNYLFNRTKYTYIINTIQSQKGWERWFKKSNLFTAIKSFKANTGNTITMWVSNN